MDRYRNILAGFCHGWLFTVSPPNGSRQVLPSTNSAIWGNPNYVRMCSMCPFYILNVGPVLKISQKSDPGLTTVIITIILTISSTSLQPKDIVMLGNPRFIQGSGEVHQPHGSSGWSPRDDVITNDSLEGSQGSWCMDVEPGNTTRWWIWWISMC